MKRLIKWLLLFTLVVVIGLTILLFNPLLVKVPVEKLLGKMSGYDVSLNGELHLSVGKQLSVHATDIHITNPAQKEQPKLAVLGSLLVSLETASLLSDAIVFSQINLNDSLIKSTPTSPVSAIGKNPNQPLRKSQPTSRVSLSA